MDRRVINSTLMLSIGDCVEYRLENKARTETSAYTYIFSLNYYLCQLYWCSFCIGANCFDRNVLVRKTAQPSLHCGLPYSQFIFLLCTNEFHLAKFSIFLINIQWPHVICDNIFCTVSKSVKRYCILNLNAGISIQHYN